jgi:hypothetical protein
LFDVIADLGEGRLAMWEFLFGGVGLFVLSLLMGPSLARIERNRRGRALARAALIETRLNLIDLRFTGFEPDRQKPYFFTDFMTLALEQMIAASELYFSRREWFAVWETCICTYQIIRDMNALIARSNATSALLPRGSDEVKTFNSGLAGRLKRDLEPELRRMETALTAALKVPSKEPSTRAEAVRLDR